ncbi:MAG: hypothetical protein OEM41_03705, partial [Ignavibacteria bacterium]|nr:hypothetical protein [Ignavibacteria bacterium]
MLDAIVSHIDLSSPSTKVLLTPSFVHPGILKRNLALKIGQLANLQVRHAREFFVDRAAPFMQGRIFITGERQFWLMADLLRSLESQLKYFADSITFEGICSLIIETISELRLNGVGKEHLLTLPNAAKWQDMVLVMEAYSALKEKGNFFDYADAVMELLRTSKPLPDSYLIRHASSAYEEELAGRCGITMIDPPSGTITGYELSGFKVDTPYQEVLQTARNLMEDMKGVTVPVRIGICAGDYHEAFYQIRPVLEKIGQTDLIHFLKGEPLLSTPVGSLWKYFAEWIQHNMSVHRLLRILGSASYDRHDVAPDVFHRAVRHFRKCPLVLFNREFCSAFEDFLNGREHVEDDDEWEEREAEATTLALAIAEKFAVIPAATGLKEQLEALRDVFAGCLRIRSEADAAAASRIDAVLDEVLVSADTMSRSATFADVVTVISKRLDGLFVHATLPDGTRPVLGTINDLIYFEFDTLYILGLNEKGPPGAFHENAILLDIEKRSLRSALPASRLRLREDRLKEDEEQFALLTATAGKRLVMSAAVRDLTTGREMLFSRYFLNEWNRYHGRHEDYQGLSTALGTAHGSLNNYIASELDSTFYDYELAVAAHVRHHRD